MDERGRNRTSKWDLIENKQNLEDNRRENARNGDYRASSNEYKSYSCHALAHAGHDNTKYYTDTKDVRSKYEADIPVRDRASGNRGTWRNNSLDRGFSESAPNWDEDGDRRHHTPYPKSSWQRPIRSTSRGKSRSRSRSPVRVYRHESGVNDRHRSGPEVPIQTCRHFTSGRCRRGSHSPFLHPSTQNYEDRRYDFEHREESYRGGKYLHYNASEGQHNDYTRDTVESKREYDRNSRGVSFNHGREREPRRSADIRCTFFAAGNCRNGNFCRFSHQIQTSSCPGERARDERWRKNHSPEKAGQVGPRKKFSDTVDMRDERWRKNQSSEKIGQVDPSTKISDTVDLHDERWRKNHSPEKIGQVDLGAKFSDTVDPHATEFGKEGRWRTNCSPDRVGQTDEGMTFSETANPHVIEHGKESQSNVVSSSVSCRWGNNIQADHAAHGGSIIMDKLVKAEANKSPQRKSDNHDSINSTSVLKGIDNWIGDKMSPEWNPKVASATAGSVNKEEPAYAIQMSDCVRHIVPSQDSQCNAPSEMPKVVEKANSQQSFNPINDNPGAFSYDKNVGSHVATNSHSSFLSGNSTQPRTHDIQIGATGNSNAIGQGYLHTPNFPGNEHASVIRTSTINYDLYSVKPNCEDPKPEATFGTEPASTTVRQAHLTDLSASLAHLLGKRQQLPQFYSDINPLNAVSSVETPNRIVCQFPVETVQPYPPTGSKEPYEPVIVNVRDVQPNTSTKLAQYPPNLGMLRTTDDVKQETPSAEQSVGEAYNNGCPERNLDLKPDMESKPNKNSQTILVESTKGKDKQAKSRSREGSPLENKVDGGKTVKDAKALRDFKHALVNFVKELLKPAWKDGQINKEGFKNTVKKVVDKVTGTIQETNIPQTPEKMDHYLSASKPKLTKLVQAYVDRNSKKQAR